MKIEGLDEVVYQLTSIAHSLNIISHGSGSHDSSAVILHRLQEMENRIMATFEELEQTLTEVKNQNEQNATTLGKIKAETTGLQNTIQSLTQAVVDLQAALAEAQAAGAVPQALIDAVAAVKTSTAVVTTAANDVDALVPDVPVV